MSNKLAVVWLLVILNFVLYAPIYLLYSPWGKQGRVTMMAAHLRIMALNNLFITKQTNRVRNCADYKQLYYEPQIMRSYTIDLQKLNPGESARCIVRYKGEPDKEAAFLGIGT